MDDGSRLLLIVVLALLACAMYFAFAETAFASVSGIKLKTDADRGDTRAIKALHVYDNFDQAVTTILICTNIIHIAIASIVTILVTRRWGISAVTLSTFATTFIVFFFGEMLPKSIAKIHSEKICLSTAASLSFFITILKPISICLAAIGNAFSSITKGDPEATVTEEELYDILDDMTEEGSINEAQNDLISSALQFGDTTVESILTSRVDVSSVDISMPPEKILDIIKNSNHSRLPAYSGTIDNIVGILQIRKFIKEYIKNNRNIDVKDLLDEAYFVHQSTKIDELLTIMSTKKLNIAIVTDNYGGTLGIVTIEDILEELVGEIWDEDDIASEPIVYISPNTYEVDPEETVGDLFDELDIEYDEEESEELHNKLLGELTFENFSSIPDVGDTFTYRDLDIAISSMEHHRIRKLTVTLCLQEQTEEKESAEL